MYSLLIATRDGERVIEYTVKDEVRQELMRLLDDGYIRQYQYQMYLGFLLNDNESVIIDGETIFEVATPVLVEADDSEGFASDSNR